jgi:ABC-type branched-subunit amino acid transport system ATPase component/ABC-type branched-subunit amino acid transport system permease subunit
MSAGALVLGVLNGLTIGLLAVGLVLVYKANRFLNLAHAQLGTLSALLVAKLVIDWGWSWWLAFVVAIAVGIATGVVVERFIVGPMRERTSSPVTLLLLSLGVSQLLLAITFIPSFSPDTGQTTQYPQPFGSDLRVGDVTLTGAYVLTALLVPALVAGLAVFMKYSILGKQIRAAANNPDAARLAGISVKRVSAITWAMAGGFSAVSAILVAPTQPSFNVSSLGPNLLLLTLGAAAFGAFVSLPGALAGGLFLGVVRQLVSASTSNASTAELVAFVVILGVVLLRGRAIARVFDIGGSVADDLPVTRVPKVLRTHGLVRHQRLLLSALGLLVAFVVPQLPYFDSAGNRFLLTIVVVHALLGVALTMVLGWAGQVSLGHFGVVAVGAYLTARWADAGWSFTAICLATGLVGAAVTVIVGLPALRVRGLTLAVTTLGFAVVTTDWLLLQSWLGTEQPFNVVVPATSIGAGLGSPDSPLAAYHLAVIVLAAGALAAAALRRSSPGRLIVAVRDNEKASAAFGFSPATVKLGILAVSGAFAGVAGTLWANAWNALEPQQFSANVSIAIIAIPVIGGLGSVAGAVLAAVALYGSTFFVGPHVAGIFGDLGNNLGFSLFLAGAGQTFVLLKYPNGLAGIVQARWQAFLDARAARIESELSSPDADVPLRVTGVTVRFGGVVALDEPDIVVHRGEIVGLIGTNGAGKTTLMNVVSGVIRPEAGSISVFGREVVDLPPDYRAAFGLSRSFQDASLFAGLTVLETLQVALSRRHKVGVPSAMVAAPWVRGTERRLRREAEELAERFGLGPWMDARAADLSTGTRRICELAAQVAARPKLILLDEPTAGVAQREAEAFGPLLRRIRDELDCAVLIVEHDMPLLMGLCDRMYALEAGSVIAEGAPEQLRDDPRVVASYLGTSDAAITRSGTATPAANGASAGPARARTTKRERPLRSAR